MSFKKYRDLILGVAALAFSGFYLYNATQIKTRPKLTPSYASAQIVPITLGILLALMAVLSIVQGVKRLRSTEAKAQQKEGKNDVMAVTLTFAVIIAYVIILPKLGFCLATMIYLFFQMLILAPDSKRNYALFAIVAVAFTAFAFLAFRVGLQQMLPRGILEELIGF